MSKRKKVKASKHAILRYMERVCGYDLTDLKVVYMVEKGYPSISRVGDAPFYDWLEENIEESLKDFRSQLYENINQIIQFPALDGIYDLSYMKVVVRDNNVVTVLEN